MDIMEAIRGRRSVRAYENRDVAPEHLAAVLDAVKWSPSWANTQCWEIVIVREAAAKQHLQAALPPKGNPAFNAIVQAPVVLALCGRLKRSGYYRAEPTTKFGDWFMFDLGIACQNLCLAAHAHGLGTVVVGLFDHARAAAALSVPADCELVALIPLGHPAKTPGAPGRREPAEFTHPERF